MNCRRICVCASLNFVACIKADARFSGASHVVRQGWRDNRAESIGEWDHRSFRLREGAARGEGKEEEGSSKLLQRTTRRQWLWNKNAVLMWKRVVLQCNIAECKRHTNGPEVI